MKTVEKILRKLAPFRVNGVSLTSNFRNMGGGVWRIGKLVLVNMYCYVPNTFSKNDYYTVATGLPEANIDSALSVTTSNSGGNREANAIVSTGGSLVVQTGNDFDLTNYTIYITGIYLAGGGIVEHAFCAISSLVRRWSHEQEYSRTVKALDKSQEGRENRSVSVGEIVCNNRLHTSSRSKNCVDFIGQKTERRLDHGRNKRLWQHVLCFVVQQYIQWDAERNGRTGYFVQTVGATALERGCSYV